MDPTQLAELPNDRKLTLFQGALSSCDIRRSQCLTEKDALGKEREQAMLAGDDKKIDAIEVRIAQVDRSLSREAAKATALESEIARLRAAADKDALEALVRKANAARAVGERLVLEAYPKAARKVAELLVQTAAIEAFIDGVNARLAIAGRPADSIAPLNDVRTRAPTVIPAHTVTDEVHDLDVAPDRVTGSIGQGILESRYRTKTVTRQVPEQVITYRAPYDTLPDICVMPAPRDGDRELWRADGQAHRDAEARAEAIVDELLR